ncbi:site-2 protease family protein [Tateyamaria pelophila]|uniref:site-2 protease family protein n=1 Tax=Tateyamaria pelophila TaxID=328415 RepID=UPI001CBEF250|nr:site-2 protease family protein [Tateyamaria pelophila]
MFTNAVKLFTLNRFDIKVDPSWLLIAALITWSLSRQFFPQVLPGENAYVYLTMAIVAMLGLFGSLLLHELAHSMVARRLGVPIKSVTLFLFGGVAELEAEPSSARVEFWIAVAGPAMSLCLAIEFTVLEYIAVWSGLSAALIEIVSYLALINLVLALFNLLPAFPLDGGRVLRAVLWLRSGDVLYATRAAAQSGAFLAYAMMTLGVVSLFRGALIGGLWQIMIGGFVLVAARTSYTQQLAKVAFDGRTVGALMTPNPITVSPDMTLSEFVNQIMLKKHVNFVPVLEGDVLLGHMDPSVLAGIDRENWANTRVDDVFVGLDQAAMTGADMPVQDLLEIISNTGQRKFLVVSDHDLLGVITLSDLTRFLSSADQDQRPHNKGDQS